MTVISLACLSSNCFHRELSSHQNRASSDHMYSQPARQHCGWCIRSCSHCGSVLWCPIGLLLTSVDVRADPSATSRPRVLRPAGRISWPVVDQRAYHIEFDHSCPYPLCPVHGVHVSFGSKYKLADSYHSLETVRVLGTPRLLRSDVIQSRLHVFRNAYLLYIDTRCRGLHKD